jgi:hypothetical protein
VHVSCAQPTFYITSILPLREKCKSRGNPCPLLSVLTAAHTPFTLVHVPPRPAQFCRRTDLNPRHRLREKRKADVFTELTELTKEDQPTNRAFELGNTTLAVLGKNNLALTSSLN